MKGGGVSQGVASTSIVANASSPTSGSPPHSPRGGDYGGSTGERARMPPAMATTSFHDELLPPAGPTPLMDGSTLDLAPVGSYNLAFGLPVRDTFESQPVRRHTADKTELVDSTIAESADTSTVLKLDPGIPYVVSVHTSLPGTCAGYMLTAFSDAVLSLSLIETTTQRVLRGSWKAASCGGSHIEAPETWTENPQYALTVTSGTDVLISLERPAKKWERFNKTHTLESMFGLYVIRGDRTGQPLREAQPLVSVNRVIHQTVFVPSHENRCNLFLEPLPGGAPYILMPATFGRGMRGPFSLGVSTDRPVELTELREKGDAP
jgi:hypothetical protein